MQVFADSRDGKAYKVESGFNIRGAHNWDEVVGVVRRAEGEYNAHGIGIGGLHRRILRSIGDYHDALEPWIKLIPTQDNYLSILCGGLKLFLGVSILVQAIYCFSQVINASLNRPQHIVPKKGTLFSSCSRALVVSAPRLKTGQRSSPRTRSCVIMLCEHTSHS